MGIRDRRWRDFDDDYNYNNSPYHYYTCNNYGYYYNPYYFSSPVYYPKVIPSSKISSVPRTVNLNSYKNYNNAVASNTKTSNGTNWVKPAKQYNNSNGGSKFGDIMRQVFTPGSSSNSSSSSSNNNRTYTPSSGSSNSGSSGSSSSGSSSGGSVSRPGRGG
jgi:hypothetical protein